MEQQVIEGNFLIAKFMGWTYPHIEHFKRDIVYHESHNYDTRWDKLKPVIDKIFEYALAHPEQVDPIRNMKIVVDIIPAWERVVTFCKWYNQNNKQK